MGITFAFCRTAKRGPRVRQVTAAIKNAPSTVYQNTEKGKHMKKEINGKTYDTDTAELCCACDLTADFLKEFRYMTEKLYRTENGDLFLFCDSEPLWEQPSAEIFRELDESRCEIIPLTEREADKWIDSHDVFYM